VDLAGFETPDQPNNPSGEFQEGVKINQNLLFLRGMIENIRKNEKVQYMNCHLTKILSSKFPRFLFS
jgi:hypothetical protein